MSLCLILFPLGTPKTVVSTDTSKNNQFRQPLIVKLMRQCVINVLQWYLKCLSVKGTVLRKRVIYCMVQYLVDTLFCLSNVLFLCIKKSKRLFSIIFILTNYYTNTFIKAYFNSLGQRKSAVSLASEINFVSKTVK